MSVTPKVENNQILHRAQMPGFLTGGGELAHLIFGFDWAGTGIGAIDAWPQNLRTAINIMLQSPVPIVMLWGRGGTMVYNDAYSVFAGKRHPQLLGSSVAEGWPEVADFNRNVMDECLQGRTLSYKDQLLTLHRNNKPEAVWMDLNYSPIMDESGKPAGVMAIVVETTERVKAERKQKRAEVVLHSEQKRLNDLFMHAPAIISVMRGPEHIYELANPLYMQAVGHRPVIGKSIRDALPELEGQGVFELYDKAYNTGKPVYGDEVQVMLDRTGAGKTEQCYFNFVYQPYFSDEGHVEGVLVHAVDLTDQVIARKELEEQNAVLEMITTGASLRDTLEFLLRSIENRSADGLVASILLMDKDEKRLRHGAAPSLPDDYNKAIDGIEIGPGVGSCGTAAYTKKPVIVTDITIDPLWKDFKGLAASHNLRSCWSTPILSAEHKSLGTFAMYYSEPHYPTEQDQRIIDFVTRTAALIIERKKAEEALVDSEERFRFMTETLPLKIFTASPLGKVTYFNPQWSEYTGVTVDYLLKNRVLKFLHPDDLEPSMQGWRQALKDGQPFQSEQRLRRFDGQYRRHLSFVRAMRDKNDKIVSWFGSMTDIEDVLQTALDKEKLEIMTAGLQEQRKHLMALNKAKDEFVALSSHQLRTPATAVKQYISFVLDGYFGTITPEQRQSLETAYDSNERQLNIINDLLKTAQLDSTNFTLYKDYQPLSDLLVESIEELQTALEIKKQKVKFTGKSDKTKLFIDRGEMKLVFVNLLENAIKYSHPGSTIRIRLRKTPYKLEVDVQDEGVGVSQADAKKIFEKFTRIDNELSDTVNGTGLGLYWVKRIVKLHRGTITVKSAVGEGSTFTVKLPLKSIAT